MGVFEYVKRKRTVQYVISLGLISLIAVIAHFSVSITGYKVVALILLLAVSLLAMVFDIFPVVLAAVFSALLWNFFFIPPLFKFTIATPEDALLFLMYFVIAMLNAVLTSKIRKAELKAKEEEERENTIKLYNTVLNSLSHELRTPIATIIGAVDALQDNPGKLTDRDRLELYGEIGLAGTRLNRQVGNLLNMSRLESGSIQAKPDWCDLNELIFRVINMVRDKPDLREIHFDPQEDLPLFRLDQGLMEQILFNIVHNSLQYTPAGTIITIRADPYENGCRVIVSDNGPGFPESELEAVFKKFYRLPNSVTGGTGLGLSIVKGFVEAQHGTIELSNQDSGGARFDLRIPAQVSNLNDWKND